MNIEVRKYCDPDLESLNYLLKEAFNVERNGYNSSNNIELVACYQDEVVGYLVLSKLYDNIKNLNYYYVNYVCVKSKYQNRGVASCMFETVFSICKKENIAYLELTSNKSRIFAHKLYEKLGFVIRDTYVFRKDFI